MMSMGREQAFAEGVVTISRLLLCALRAANVPTADFLTMIDALPGDKESTGQAWRTSEKGLSGSRSARPQGAVIEGLPEGMPHIAGDRTRIFLTSTYIQYTDDVRFYGSSHDQEHMMLKGVEMPATAMLAIAGMDLHRVVTHPCIDAADPVRITRARRVSGGTALDLDRTTNRSIIHPIHGEIAIKETTE